MIRALLLLLVACPAFAGDLIVSGAMSSHSNGRYCEANPTLGWIHERDETIAFGVAGSRNSLCRGSVYLVARVTPWSVGPVRVGGAMIAATGYERALVLAPALVLLADIGIAQPMLSLVPPLEGGPTAAVLSIAWRFR